MGWNHIALDRIQVLRPTLAQLPRMAHWLPVLLTGVFCWNRGLCGLHRDRIRGLDGLLLFLRYLSLFQLATPDALLVLSLGLLVFEDRLGIHASFVLVQSLGLLLLLCRFLHFFVLDKFLLHGNLLSH